MTQQPGGLLGQTVKWNVQWPTGQGCFCAHLESIGVVTSYSRLWGGGGLCACPVGKCIFIEPLAILLDLWEWEGRENITQTFSQVSHLPAHNLQNNPTLCSRNVFIQEFHHFPNRFSPILPPFDKNNHFMNVLGCSIIIIWPCSISFLRRLCSGTSQCSR